MLKGFKHTAQCNCNKEQFTTYGQLETFLKTHEICDKCKGKYEYIGFQPEYDNILSTISVDNMSDSIEVNTQEVMNKTKDVEEEVLVEKTEVAENEIKEPEVIEEDTMEDDKIEDTQLQSSNEMDINTLIDTSSRISNRQMIPALKENINDKEALRTLINHYEKVFISAFKYLPKRSRGTVLEVIQEKQPSFTE